MDITTEKLGLGEVIEYGWDYFRLNFWKILPIFLLIYIPINTGLAFIPLEEMIEEQGVSAMRTYKNIVQLTEFFIGVIATLALAHLIEQSILGRPVTWQAAMAHSFSRWPSAIGTGMLAGLIVVGLTFLLIVPGIIVSLWDIKTLAFRRLLQYVAEGHSPGNIFRKPSFRVSINRVSSYTFANHNKPELKVGL